MRNNIMGGTREAEGEKHETCKGLRVHSAPRIILLFSFFGKFGCCAVLLEDPSCVFCITVSADRVAFVIITIH